MRACVDEFTHIYIYIYYTICASLPQGIGYVVGKLFIATGVNSRKRKRPTWDGIKRPRLPWPYANRERFQPRNFRWISKTRRPVKATLYAIDRTRQEKKRTIGLLGRTVATSSVFFSFSLSVFFFFFVTSIGETTVAVQFRFYDVERSSLWPI